MLPSENPRAQPGLAKAEQQLGRRSPLRPSEQGLLGKGQGRDRTGRGRAAAGQRAGSWPIETSMLVRGGRCGRAERAGSAEPAQGAQVGAVCPTPHISLFCRAPSQDLVSKHKQGLLGPKIAVGTSWAESLIPPQTSELCDSEFPSLPLLFPGQGSSVPGRSEFPGQSVALAWECV